MKTRTAPTSARQLRRAGLTLMESVVAVAILAILASTVIGGISMVMSQQVRQQRRLACAELSNRLILMYLDDPESMPNQSLPIGYGNERYRWEIVTNPVQINSARADLAAELEDKTSMTLDRINAVTIRVWLSEESGGTIAPSPSAPTYAITRLVDPVSNITRNPDSLSYAAKSESGRERLIGTFRGADRGGVLRRSGSSSGTPSGSKPGDKSGVKPGPSGTKGDPSRPGGSKSGTRPGSGTSGTGGAGGTGGGRSPK